ASAPEHVDTETCEDQLLDHARDSVRDFLADAQVAGAQVLWNIYGPSIKVTRDKTRRQGAYLETKRFGATIQASGVFPEEPFANAAARLVQLGVGAPGSW